MKMEIRRKDVILVCLFTIGFFCIALWGLGSHSIPQTEQELSAMIDDLTGSDFDMQGLKELQALLGGV